MQHKTDNELKTGASAPSKLSEDTPIQQGVSDKKVSGLGEPITDSDPNFYITQSKD